MLENKSKVLLNKSLMELMSLHSPFAFFVVDNRTDEILYFNHQFCEMWGICHLEEQMKRGELKNNDIIPYCLPILEDVQAFAESCKPLQSEENRVVLEDEIPFINNRTIRRFTMQIRGEDDLYYGRYYIFEDISIKKEMERERKNSELKLQDALEDIEELFRLAQETEKLKTEFFANVSHEFRTPLSVIIGTIKLAEMDKIECNMVTAEKENERFETIKRNSNRLLRVVNNLLDITKADAGFMSLELKNIDVVSTIKEIVSTTKNYAIINSIAFDFKASIIEKRMALDVEKIERVMLNLISNAIKFTPPGGSIEISISESQDIISICVQDTGIGIPDTMVETIFDRFRQVDTSFRRKNVGTGLGLTLVKRFVEMHNGKISVYSELGKGSKFYVQLPISLVEESRSDISMFYRSGNDKHSPPILEQSDIKSL